MNIISQVANSLSTQLNNGVNRISQKLANNSKDGQSDRTSDDDNGGQSLSSNLLLLLAQFEDYFVSIQSILIWERPYISAISLIGFNCLYWLIVSWTRRFFSILSIVLLLLSFYSCWTYYVWPEVRARPPETDGTEDWTPIHPKVLSAPEISHYINEILIMTVDILDWFSQLRKNQPGVFCSLVTVILTITAIIGRLVPGVVIVYIIMMTVALGPGFGLYVVPESWFHSVRGYLGRTPSSSSSSSSSRSSSGPIGHEKELSRQSSEESVKGLSSEQLEESFDLDKDESSLQLLSTSQLDQTLDFELGLRPVEDSNSTASSSNHSLQLVPSNQFGNGTETGDELEDYEIISDSELPRDEEQDYNGRRERLSHQEQAKRNMLESDL